MEHAYAFPVLSLHFAQLKCYQVLAATQMAAATLRPQMTAATEHGQAVLPLDDSKRKPSDSGSADMRDYMQNKSCLLYTSPSPRDTRSSRMPSSA